MALKRFLDWSLQMTDFKITQKELVEHIYAKLKWALEMEKNVKLNHRIKTIEEWTSYWDGQINALDSMLLDVQCWDYDPNALDATLDD